MVWRIATLAGQGDEFPGIEQPLRIERALDRAQRTDARRRGQPGQFRALHLADAMFGRDRAARRDHRVMDEGVDRLSLAPDPAGPSTVPAGRADMKMDIAVAQMAEGGRRRAGKARHVPPPPPRS